MKKYFDDWGSWGHDGLVEDFSGYDDNFEKTGPPPDLATDAEIVYAAYAYRNYSGSALVIFERDGKLFEVNASHCSCNGLDGQWLPEETTWDAVGTREIVTKGYEEYWDDFSREAVDALKALVLERTEGYRKR